MTMRFRNSGRSPDRQTTTVGSRFPDPYEIRLRTYVEAEFSSTSPREENLARAALAAIRCKPLRRAESVVYVDFPTVNLLGDYYDSRVRGLRLRAGVCDGKDAVPEDSYSYGKDNVRGGAFAT